MFGLASFLIAAFAFGFGAARLFRRGKPMYLQLLVAASGCFALQQLSYTVNMWCGVRETVSIGMLGIFGCNFFLLSANYGTLDRIVDEGRDIERVRLRAAIAPVVMAVLTVFAFLAWREKDMFCAVAWVVMLLPALPASYFDLKHVLLPTDPFGLLRATRPCNIAALLFYTVTAAYVICSASAESAAVGVLSALMSLSVLALSLCAVRGARKWGI